MKKMLSENMRRFDTLQVGQRYIYDNSLWEKVCDTQAKCIYTDSPLYRKDSKYDQWPFHLVDISEPFKITDHSILNGKFRYGIRISMEPLSTYKNPTFIFHNKFSGSLIGEPVDTLNFP